METPIVTRLDRDGIGLADSADGVIEVPGGLPGEAIGTEDSEQRQTPPCPAFGRCGGCTLQHANDAFVAAWKRDQVAHALASRGLSAEIRTAMTSPPQSRRRATLSGRRTKKSVEIGFHARRSDRIVPLTTCEVLTPALTATVPQLAQLVRLGASRSSQIRMTLTDGTVGVDVSVTEAKPLTEEMLVALTGLSRGFARLTWNGSLITETRPPVQRLGPAEIVPPAGAFLQATAEGEVALVQAVTEAVGAARRIVDLFAGCGTFSLPLAQRSEVHALEGSAEMLAALDKGWRQAEGLKQVTHEARDLFRRPVLRGEFKGFDAVVIDPPRAGAEAQVAEIAASDLSLLAYVSCNPDSFARDVAMLVEAGFAIDWVQPVDQFRWSGHVELAARLSR